MSSTKSNTDETLLIAYADGELDAETSLQIEAELEKDPSLAERVRGYQQDAALLKSALQSALYGTPTALPGIDAETGRRSSAHRLFGSAARGRAIPWTLAASMAALALGMGLERMLVGANNNGRSHAERAAVDTRYSSETLEASLERSVSGVSSVWRNPDTGARGEVTPVRTFRTASGRYCREYREVQWLALGREETGGIACRQENGMWKVRIRYYPD